jgi:DNA polymerase-3 subunit epsilon
VIFVDVETTGLSNHDRIVSFAGILLETAQLLHNKFEMKVVYLICDPGRKSHPRAQEVHGYSDWMLRHQEPLSAHIAAIEAVLNEADLIVAHNAAFDLGFISREFAALGKPIVSKPSYCTMEGHWRSGSDGSAKLDALARKLGLSRAGATHGALEDAWLVMMVYLDQQGCPRRIPFDAFPSHSPSNLGPVPPAPEGALPQRKRPHARRGQPSQSQRSAMAPASEHADQATNAATISTTTITPSAKPV